MKKNIYRIVILLFSLISCSANFAQGGLAIVRIEYKPFHIDLDVDYSRTTSSQRSTLYHMGIDITKVHRSDWKDKIVEQFEERGWLLYRETEKILEFQIDTSNPIDNSSPDASILYAKIKYHPYYTDLDVDYEKVNSGQISKLNSIGAYIKKVEQSHWKDKIIDQFEDKGWILYSEVKDILRFQIDIGSPIDNSSPDASILYAKIKYHPYYIDLDVNYEKINSDQMEKLSSIGAYIKEVKQSDWKDKIIEQFEDRGWAVSRETEDILEFEIDVANPIDNSSSDASVLYAKIKYHPYYIDLDVDYGKKDSDQMSKLNSIGAYIKEVKQSDWKDKIIEQFEDKGWTVSRETEDILEFEIDVANPIDNSSPDASILYAKIKHHPYYIDLDVDYGKITSDQMEKLSSIGAYVKEVKQSDWKNKIIEQFEDKGWAVSREAEDILEFRINVESIKK